MNETRAKAGAILSGHKLRMLEDTGITVVTKERLDTLERLYDASKRREEVLSEKCPFYNDYSPEALAWWSQSNERLYVADDDVETALKELEAMDK